MAIKELAKVRRAERAQVANGGMVEWTSRGAVDNAKIEENEKEKAKMARAAIEDARMKAAYDEASQSLKDAREARKGDKEEAKIAGMETRKDDDMVMYEGERRRWGDLTKNMKKQYEVRITGKVKMSEQGTPINEDALVTYAGVQMRYGDLPAYQKKRFRARRKKECNQLRVA